MERPQPQDKPTVFFNTVFEDDRYVNALAKRDEQVADIIYSYQESFTTQELERTVEMLLDSVSKDDAYWTQDRRSAAVEVLDNISLDRIPPETLFNQYIFKLASVANQDTKPDVFGPVTDLIEVGKILAPHFNPTDFVRGQTAFTWSEIANRYRDSEQEYIENRMEEVINSIPQPENLQEDNRLGAREMPDFDPGERVLHDNYMETVRKVGTFKLKLWEATPGFRSECEDLGIDLTRYWNLSNPNVVAENLQLFRDENDPRALTTLNKHLKVNTGLSLDELSDDKSKVVADEILLSAFHAKNELAQNAGSFDNVIARLRKELEGARNAPVLQRVLLRNAANFFREYGIEIEGGSEQIMHALYDRSTLENVQENYTGVQSQKIESADKLERIFNLRGFSRRFSLSSRTRQDMFLGDETGDCTSYHLSVGMNAWTVPVWLSNPGFNFFKIQDESGLLAKLGILLAESGNKPVIVVDSFEVRSNGIEDEEKAKEAIFEGLARLKSWAEEIGVKKVNINTFSNSSDISTILTPRTKQSTDNNLFLVGGLDGISEMRKNILGTKESEERIYLQTRTLNFEVVRTENTDRDNVLREFEGMINSALAWYDNTERRRIRRLAQNKDWLGVFEYIAEYHFPHVTQILGAKWPFYKELLPDIKIDQYGSIKEDPIELRPIESRMSQIAAELEAAKNRGLEDEDDEDDYIDLLTTDAGDCDDFLELLKKMEILEITPEQGLEFLYSATKTRANDNSQIKINPRLPVLV